MKVDQARKSKSPKANKAYESQEETFPSSGIAESTADQAFDDLTRLAAHLCKVPLASVNLIEACCQWLQSQAGPKHSERPTDFTFGAHALLRADILLVPDTLLDERFATSTLVIADPPIRFYAGMPLFTAKGQALGVLCVMDYVPRELNLEQVEALRALGHQVVTQLELMRNLLEKERTASNPEQIEANCAWRSNGG